MYGHFLALVSLKLVGYLIWSQVLFSVVNFGGFDLWCNNIQSTKLVGTVLGFVLKRWEFGIKSRLHHCPLWLSAHQKGKIKNILMGTYNVVLADEVARKYGWWIGSFLLLREFEQELLHLVYKIFHCRLWIFLFIEFLVHSNSRNQMGVWCVMLNILQNFYAYYCYCVQSGVIMDHNTIVNKSHSQKVPSECIEILWVCLFLLEYCISWVW